VVRLDRETSVGPDGTSARRVRDFVLRHRPRFDVLVISDYAKGAIGPSCWRRSPRRTRARPSSGWSTRARQFPALTASASLMKPNREEAADAAGIEDPRPPTLRAAGERLLARWQAGAVLISRGEEGMALFKPGGRPAEFPPSRAKSNDVTGAGDTVLAACALALGAGGSLEEATLLANHAAGVVVGKIGTATVSAEELRAAVRGA